MDIRGGRRPHPALDVMEIDATVPISQYPPEAIQRPVMFPQNPTPMTRLIAFTGTPILNIRCGAQPYPAMRNVVGIQVVGLHCGNFVNPGVTSLITIHSSRLSNDLVSGATKMGAPTTTTASDIIGVIHVTGNNLLAQEQQCIVYYTHLPRDYDSWDITMRHQPTGAVVDPGATTMILNLTFYTLPNPGV